MRLTLQSLISLTRVHSSRGARARHLPSPPPNRAPRPHQEGAPPSHHNRILVPAALPLCPFVINLKRLQRLPAFGFGTSARLPGQPAVPKRLDPELEQRMAKVL